MDYGADAIVGSDESDSDASDFDDESGEDWDELERKAKKCRSLFSQVSDGYREDGMEREFG
jgi:nucleosome binding factor SPN SPT16 subunit